MQSKIRNYEKQIIQLEQKLLRSQSAYVKALLEHKAPEEKDIYYHEKYMGEIEGLRKKIQICNDKLSHL